MTPFKLSGTKTLNLSAEEVALVLDALAGKPYAQVAGLIGKIVTQARDVEPPPLPEVSGD